MERKLWFDVKARTPHENDEWNDLDASVRRTYREINFMTHLMWNAPYRLIHGPFKDLIPHIKDNVGRADWPSDFANAVAPLQIHLDLMANDAAVGSGLTHLELHLDYRQSAISFVDICRSLRSVLERFDDGVPSGPVPLYPVCFPFIEAQDLQQFPPAAGRPGIIAAASDIRAFTMHDLYDRANLRGKTYSIKILREAGVLRTRATGGGAGKRDEVGPEGGQGNGYECNGAGTGCVRLSTTAPSCYCSTDSEGNCSAMTTCP